LLALQKFIQALAAGEAPPDQAAHRRADVRFQFFGVDFEDRQGRWRP